MSNEANLTPANDVTWRRMTKHSDVATIRHLVESTDFFRNDEVDVAVELVEERLSKGDSSGYNFIFAEVAGRVVGYACFGPIACTVGGYDLYWIAVVQNEQRAGLGKRLVREVERDIAQLAGRHIYIETSGQPKYAPTRAFYERCGYSIIATIPDFYDINDDKVIWRKVLDFRSKTRRETK